MTSHKPTFCYCSELDECIGDCALIVKVRWNPFEYGVTRSPFMPKGGLNGPPAEFSSSSIQTCSHLSGYTLLRY